MIDLHADPVDLTAALVDIESVSKNEKNIADQVEEALRAIGDVEVFRYGNTVMAKTNRGLGQRVILAGHLDTVPTADNVPSRREGDLLYGCGSVDMKGGDAVFLHAFATLAHSERLTRDMTVIFYECEEIAASENGLRKLAEAHPEWLEGDVAILGEPTDGFIEGGCQGSVRVKVTAHGRRAHSARSWLGENAIHRLAPVLARVAQYEGDRVVPIDGLEYREGLNVVVMEAGVATNTIPDVAWCFVNFRFAPNRSATDALNLVWDVVGVGTPEAPAEGFELEIDDVSPGALPGLSHPAAAALVEATGGRARAKYGWTDVARFAQLGIPAVNFGPGDPALCHTKDEHVQVESIRRVSEEVLRYLTT